MQLTYDANAIMPPDGNLSLVGLSLDLELPPYQTSPAGIIIPNSQWME